MIQICICSEKIVDGDCKALSEVLVAYGISFSDSGERIDVFSYEGSFNKTKTSTTLGKGAVIIGKKETK
jgi:hypothetical protein